MAVKNGFTIDMRARVAINHTGTILGTDGETVPAEGILMMRKKTEIHILIEEPPTFRAIVTLIGSLHAMSGKMLYHRPAHPTQTMPKREFCLFIAQKALRLIEQESESPFASNLQLFNTEIPSLSKMPPDFTTLGQLEVKNVASAVTLMRASEMNIPHLVVVAQNRSLRFFFVALPLDFDWPVTPPRTHHLIEDECDDLTARWLTLLYDTALAVKRPLYQDGTITLGHDKIITFHRILLPVTPTNERPANHRLLSATICSNDPDLILI